MRVGSFVLASVIGLAAGFPAVAQVAPQVNPGLIESDVERQRLRIEREQQVPKQQGPAVVGPQRAPRVTIPGGGDRFLLRKVNFDESKFITPEELDAVASRYVGRQIDIAGLDELVNEINQIYVARGIVTAVATLPEQTVGGGLLKIKLTEGRLQRSSVEGNKQTSEAYVRSRIDPPAGEVLDVPKLNRDVVWFNRTNDVQMRALLQPGTDFGLTDLQLAITEPPVNTLQFFADNQGVETTGKYQGGVYYRRHGLLGIDDRLTFYGVKAEGNINGNVAYNFPINPWGGRLGASYTQGDIKIIKGQFAALDVTGKSNQAAVNFGQPIYATSEWLVQANAAYVYGNSQSDFAGVSVTSGRYGKTTGGFSVTHSGNEHTVTVAPAVNGINWHDKILGGERSFSTYTGSANASVRLPAQFSISLLSSGQYTREQLLPGDQLFSIGGPTTVRGFPTNTAAGDSGYYFNLELHRNMGDLIAGLGIYAFLDHGAVFSTFPALTQLESAGVGLSWSPFASLTFEASVGFPWHKVIVGQDDHQFYGRITFRPLLLL